jgi:phosphoglycolate phosphatase
MVGDTTHDLLMAKAAGIRCIAVTYGVHDMATLRACGPTWLADSFREVVGLLPARGCDGH